MYDDNVGQLGYNVFQKRPTLQHYIYSATPWVAKFSTWTSFATLICMSQNAARPLVSAGVDSLLLHLDKISQPQMVIILDLPQGMDIIST